MDVIERPYNVLHTLRSVRVDGVVKVLLRYVTHFRDERFRHHVCSMRPEDPLAGEFRERGFDPLFVQHRGVIDGPRSVRRLVRIIRRLEIDLVHTNRTLDLLLAGTAARICGIPVVSSFHWLGRASDHPEDDSPWLGRKAHELLISLLNRSLADRVVAVSGAVMDGLAHVPAFPVDRTEVIYPGIPMKPETPADAEACARLKHEMGLDGARPIILNVGRLEPVKGQAHLIPMMRLVRERLPDATLLIAGDGALRASLESDIRRQGLTNGIRLLGSRSDVDALLAISDLLVLSSESEAAPLPPVEAMRAGRPVVATAVGGVPEIVADGVTGAVVPRADPRALAGAVLDILQNTDRAREMGEAGRRIAHQRFDIARSVLQLERLYGSLLERPAPARTRTVEPPARAAGTADAHDAGQPERR